MYVGTIEIIVALVLLVVALFADILIARHWAATVGPQNARELIISDPEYQEIRERISEIQAKIVEESDPTAAIQGQLDELREDLAPRKAQDIAGLVTREVKGAMKGLDSHFEQEAERVSRSVAASVRNHAKKLMEQQMEELMEQKSVLDEAVVADMTGHDGRGVEEVVAALQDAGMDRTAAVVQAGEALGFVPALIQQLQGQARQDGGMYR